MRVSKKANQMFVLTIAVNKMMRTRLLAKLILLSQINEQFKNKYYPTASKPQRGLVFQCRVGGLLMNFLEKIMEMRARMLTSIKKHKLASTALAMLLMTEICFADCAPRPATPIGIIGIPSEGEPITLTEAQLIPPECVLLFAHKGCGVEWYASLKNNGVSIEAHPIFSVMNGATSYHHVCWAQVAKARYFKAQKKIDRDRYLEQWRGGMLWTIKHDEWLPKNYKYMNRLYSKLGEAEEQGGNYGRAITAHYKSIELDPKQIESYALLSSVLLKANKKKEARDFVQKGLSLDGSYKPLRRLYRKITGTEFVDIDAVKPTVEPNQKPEEAKTELDQVSPQIIKKASSHEGLKDEKLTPDSMQSDGDSKVKKYCRFCP